MRLDGSRLAGLAAVALATLMGVHALRGSLAMIVWNIGTDRPAPVLGGIALAVYAVGLAGWVFRGARGAHAGVSRALVFAAAYTLSPLIRHTLLTPAFALTSLVGWLWTFPALIAR